MSDDLDKQLRAAAQAAIHGAEVMAGAVQFLNDLYAAVEGGQLLWRNVEGPRGSRAINGVSPKYNVMVVQYNTGTFVDHAGMFTVLSGNINVIVLPKPFANWVFHKAQGTLN